LDKNKADDSSNHKALKLQDFLKNQTIKIRKIHRKGKNENSNPDNSDTKNIKYMKYDSSVIKNIDQ